MTDWTETYRGSVPPWHCDVTEHFTIAYYFDRLEEAQANLAETLGIEAIARDPGLVRRLNLRFVRELRAGASFHVQSAPLGVQTASGSTDLRLGHRFLESGSGDVVTWIDEHWDLPSTALSADRTDAIKRQSASWDGPAFETRSEAATTDGFMLSGMGRIKPGDVDSTGRGTLSAMVHRFSAANAQIAAALGLDAEYLQRHRRGFSTFELALRTQGCLLLDEPYQVRSAIGHLGGSSLRLMHSLVNARTNTEIARLSQFGVNLDLDARRPTRWPDEFRDRAAPLVVPVG